jgi:hypothetical protein
VNTASRARRLFASSKSSAHKLQRGPEKWFGAGKFLSVKGGRLHIVYPVIRGGGFSICVPHYRVVNPRTIRPGSKALCGPLLGHKLKRKRLRRWPPRAGSWTMPPL